MPKRKIGCVDASIGRNLVYYRKLEGLTQQEVAEQLNINRSTYTKYETGISEPGIAMLKELAKIFHVTPAHLLADTPDDDAAADVIEGNLTKERHYHLIRREINDMSEESWQQLCRFIKQLKA